jgi:hypothetical protein
MKPYLTSLQLTALYGTTPGFPAPARTVSGVVLHLYRKVVYIYDSRELRPGDVDAFNHAAEAWWTAESSGSSCGATTGGSASGLPITCFCQGFDERFAYTLRAYAQKEIADISGAPPYELSQHFSGEVRKYRLKADGTVRDTPESRALRQQHRKPREKLALAPATHDLIVEMRDAGASHDAIVTALNERCAPRLKGSGEWCKKRVKWYLLHIKKDPP